MYVGLEVDGWGILTPTNIYSAQASTTSKHWEPAILYSTHMLRFYGWYVDNVYIEGMDEVNIYISYNAKIKLAYRFAKIRLLLIAMTIWLAIYTFQK